MAKQDNTIWWILGLILVFIVILQSGALKNLGLAAIFSQEQIDLCNSTGGVVISPNPPENECDCSGKGIVENGRYIFSPTYGCSFICNRGYKLENNVCVIIPERELCISSDGIWKLDSNPEDSCKVLTQIGACCQCPANSVGFTGGFGCDYAHCLLEMGTGCSPLLLIFGYADVNLKVLEKNSTTNIIAKITEIKDYTISESKDILLNKDDEITIYFTGIGSPDGWKTSLLSVGSFINLNIRCLDGRINSGDIFTKKNCYWEANEEDIKIVEECTNGQVKYAKCGEGEGFKQFIQATCSNGKWQYVVNVIAPCTIPCLQGYDYINQNCIKNATLPPTCPEGYVLIGSDCVLQQQPSIFQKYMMWFIIGGIILVFGYLLWEKGEGGFFRK